MRRRWLVFIAVTAFAPSTRAQQAQTPAVADIEKALALVYYKDCDPGSGKGKMKITFAPAGHVQSALVAHGNYDGPTRMCLQTRFRDNAGKVPPFSGPPYTGFHRIEL